jgi:hypothetical protein
MEFSDIPSFWEQVQRAINDIVGGYATIFIYLALGGAVYWGIIRPVKRLLRWKHNRRLQQERKRLLQQLIEAAEKRQEEKQALADAKKRQEETG